MSRQTSTNHKNSQGTFWKIAEFAARLRAERSRIRLNQKDFASLGGATLDSQSRYETGKNVPSAEYLAGLAANRVDILYVLTGQRTAADSLEPDAAEALDDYLSLSPEKQQLARALLKTMREQSAPVLPEPTLHSPHLTYHAGGRD